MLWIDLPGSHMEKDCEQRKDWNLGGWFKVVSEVQLEM
jgi:hypothetical protein